MTSYTSEIDFLQTGLDWINSKFQILVKKQKTWPREKRTGVLFTSFLNTIVDKLSRLRAILSSVVFLNRSKDNADLSYQGDTDLTVLLIVRILSAAKAFCPEFPRESRRFLLFLTLSAKSITDLVFLKGKNTF